MNIDGKTLIYGIIGNPVSHSLSPLMHNAAFTHLGENRVYLPFPVANLESGIEGLKGLNIQGVSVTIPHKEAVIAYLDWVDPIAERIGAVNTIICERENEQILLKGYNTDWLGAVLPLKKNMELQGAKIVLLGAGGSARAIGFGLLEAGAKIVICSRTPSRGQKLAEDLGCEWCALDKVSTLQGEGLVNATSVGMAPQQDQCPVPTNILAGFEVVMDIVYAPLKTMLLNAAEEKGCRIINGLEMLLYQGIAQFEMWTGRDAPEEEMRRILTEAVAGN